ncbi:MAG: 50S ribosomal protein L29 [Verrucomicrobiales bacterium]|jgi:large subunit ribosomal protein L29|nr:50S ribosomal protein L29 [Verrucomicrobiales bacterium]MDR1304842.1 50S ribosomal protein L29 [Verrucomicrobiales bacterium]
MKIADVKALSDAELHARITELKQEKLNLRIQQQGGRLERPSRLTEIRKTIARIRTVLSQRRLAVKSA